MLTRRQSDCLRFIIEYVEENDGVSPCFDEIGDAIGLRSKSGIHRLLSALEDRGFISRLKHKYRGITPLKRPSGELYAYSVSHISKTARERMCLRSARFQCAEMIKERMRAFSMMTGEQAAEGIINMMRAID